MKITDHIKSAKGKTLFSFELLPPMKGQSIQWIYDAIDPLMEFKPPFIDVTSLREDYIYKQKDNGLLEKVSYRKRPGTIAICAAIINKYGVDAVPHLICGGFTKEETENAVGRSFRQLNVYHNILNIVGDRLRANPNSSITLSGASFNGPEEGKMFANEIKTYLVSNYGIEDSRISTVGRTKPVSPSEQPGGSKEIALLREGDRRVDITSSSTALMLEVGGGMMKPIQIVANQTDPLDSYVLFNVNGAEEMLKTWSVTMTDDDGKVQSFGPYTKNQGSFSGKAILGNRTSGNYKVVMTGVNKKGEAVIKESKVNLVRQYDLIEKAYRFSILFDFDKTKTLAKYENFLKNSVAPLIEDGSTVVIHGHTDVIGSEDYNYTLSRERAIETQRLLNNALKSSGKNNVKFETRGFGEDLYSAPFDNNTPEERFYNRTVVIDIIPSK